MDLRTNKNYDELLHKISSISHDKIISNIMVKEKTIEFKMYNDFELNNYSKHKLIIQSINNIIDSISIYTYTISNGSINGCLEFDDFLNDKLVFQIIDIGYLDYNILIKGSIIENNRLNRKNLIFKLDSADITDLSIVFDDEDN